MERLKEDYNKGGITFEELVERLRTIVGPTIENVARNVEHFRKWLEQCISMDTEVIGLEAKTNLEYFGNVERYGEIMQDVEYWKGILNYERWKKLTRDELEKLAKLARNWEANCRNLHYEWAKKRALRRKRKLLHRVNGLPPYP